MTDPAPEPAAAQGRASLRVKLLLIVAIAVVVGITVGVVRGPGDGLIALLSTGLAGASFLLLFQPPTEARGNRDRMAAVDFGQGGGGGPDRKLNRLERRAQAREAKRLEKQRRKEERAG